MSITCGFYNSVNHDRKYNAEQFAYLIDCLITDGVLDKTDGIFETVPGEGLQVIVKPGFAWFDHTWTKSDSAVPLTIQQADVTMARYDAVVLEVNEEERINDLKVITGTPSGAPIPPTMVDSDAIHQHPLAYVKVRGGTGSILASDIQILVGQSDCPFATGILESADISELFSNWENQFDIWFENLKSKLTGDVATNLQNQIDEMKPRTPYLYSGKTEPTSEQGKNQDIYIKII